MSVICPTDVQLLMHVQPVHVISADVGTCEGGDDEGIGVAFAAIAVGTAVGGAVHGCVNGVSVGAKVGHVMPCESSEQ